MNINGINPALSGIRLPNADPGSRVQQDRGAVPAAQTLQQVARPAAPETRAASAAPVEAPAGTDPELWAVLTTEERAFFAKAGAMGPLTYGHVISNGFNAAPVSRGGRLDVRV